MYLIQLAFMWLPLEGDGEAMTEKKEANNFWK